MQATPQPPTGSHPATRDATIAFHQAGSLSPTFGGQGFGEVGAYEWVLGRVQGRVDPQHRLNRGIALIDDAPRDAEGWVRYSADIAILKPVDLRRGNGWLLYDVANRGTKRAVQRINSGVASNLPQQAAEAGVGYLMKRGFSMVWSAWQGDVPAGGGRMLADLPVARRQGQPITGMACEEFILDMPSPQRDDGIVELSPTCFRARLSYPVADRAEPAQLTVRARASDVRQCPAGLTWSFVDDCTIEITRTGEAGFDRGAIHEFVYRARDPRVMGLGLASMRDVVSFLRHAPIGFDGDANPLAGHVRHALGFGLSQSGRVLRDFLHEGFNEDLQGRAVFDAAMPVIAGSRRAFLNQPFSQPGRFSRQHEDHGFPGDQFPFSYGTQFDPISGRTDGILRRAEAAGVAPKLMHLDTDSEFFSARSSLVVTDCEGRDAALPDNVRFYLASSVAHGDYALPPEVAAAPGNTLTYGSLARALIDALVAWVERGIEPPPSCHPRRADGTLLDLQAVRRQFPVIPGAGFPVQINELQLADHAVLPARLGRHYPVYLPAVDADGNGCAGVPHPLTTAPVGTHTGWQIRRHGFAEGELFNVFGAFWPFARTEAQAQQAGDPRASIEARYGSPPGWHEHLARALQALVRDRFLLHDDCERLIAQARLHHPLDLIFIPTL